MEPSNADLLRAREIYGLLVKKAMQDEYFRSSVIHHPAGQLITWRARRHDFSAAQRRLTGLWPFDTAGRSQPRLALELDAITQHRDPSWAAYQMAQGFTHAKPSHLLLYAAVGSAVSDLRDALGGWVEDRHLPVSVGSALLEAAVYTAVNAVSPFQLTINPVAHIATLFFERELDEESLLFTVLIDDAGRNRIRQSVKRKTVPGWGRRTRPGSEATSRKAEWYWRTKVKRSATPKSIAEEVYGADDAAGRARDVKRSNKETTRLMNLIEEDDY